MHTPEESLPLEKPPGNKQKSPGNKYPLEAPPAAHVAEIEAAMRMSEPPKYASQLKRRGGKVDVTAADERDMEGTDAMIEELEEEVGKEVAKDAQKEIDKKAKAKAKGKAKSKPKKSQPAEPEELVDPEGVGANKGLDECVEENVPYPDDPYEPPAHITANHIYSNVYRRTMTNGLNKEAAAEAGRMQGLIFRTHGVVSKAMVGTFRAPKASKAAEK